MLLKIKIAGNQEKKLFISLSPSPSVCFSQLFQLTADFPKSDCPSCFLFQSILIILLWRHYFVILYTWDLLTAEHKMISVKKTMKMFSNIFTQKKLPEA